MTPTAQQMQASLSNFPRTLHWGNFSVVNHSPNPPHQAHTSSTYSANYRNVHLTNGAYTLNGVRVSATLNQQGTWVVTNQQTNALLRHEQGHYDITGLISRDLCWAMLSLEIDAALTENQRAAEIYLRDEARKLYNKARVLSETLQTHYVNGQPQDGLYDSQTAHGGNALMQQKWNEIFRHATDNNTQLSLTMWVYSAISDTQMGSLGF